MMKIYLVLGMAMTMGFVLGSQNSSGLTKESTFEPTNVKYSVRNAASDEFITDRITADMLLGGDSKYVDFSELKVSSEAVYAGQTAMYGGSAIQMRSKNSNSGIVTTTSGGVIKEVSIKWNADTTKGREVGIYVSNSKFNDATDLYNIESTVTKIAELCVDNADSQVSTYTIPESKNYNYVGIRSESGALYLEEVNFSWAPVSAETPEIPVDSISIDQGDEVELGPNESFKLTATVLPEDADIKDVEWSSENPSIVSVDGDGTIHGVGPGTATITATSVQDRTKTDSIKISVKMEDVKGSSAVLSADDFSEYSSSDPQYIIDESNYCIEYVNTYYAEKYSEIYMYDNGEIYSSEFNVNAPAIASIALEPYNYDSYLDYSADVLIGDEMPEPVGDGTYYVYTATDLNNDGTFLITSSTGENTVWLKNIIINFVTSETKAEAFAAEFNEWMDFACDVSGQVPPDAETWSLLKEEFMALDASTQSLLRDGSAVQGGDEIEDALWLYDYVVGKYNPSFDPDSSYDDWMGRKPGPQSAYAGVGSTDSLNPTIVAAVGLGVLAILSGIGFAFYKKRREA